jgi:3'(2'), 5'-bisphosphate nucleotidase
VSVPASGVSGTGGAADDGSADISAGALDRRLTRPHPSRFPSAVPGYEESLRRHLVAIEEGDPGYLDPISGLFVLTAVHHFERGTCCEQGCRHCPFVWDRLGDEAAAPAPESTLVSDDDHRIAIDVAHAAGLMLVALRQELTGRGVHPFTVRDEGDRQAHHMIVDALAMARPGDHVLSEEGYPDPARLLARRVWIVDPLDGTREYGIPGRSDWAVHIALSVDGHAAAGAVALPALGTVFGTSPGHPTPERPAGRPLQIACSRSHPAGAAVYVARKMDGDLVPIGSAGAKAMAVVMGECDAYIHHGGQYEWDNCAPAAVAAAAGLHASRLDGSPLRYNRPDPWLPDLLICRPELAEPILDLLLNG